MDNLKFTNLQHLRNSFSEFQSEDCLIQCFDCDLYCPWDDIVNIGIYFGCETHNRITEENSIIKYRDIYITIGTEQIVAKLNENLSYLLLS